MLVPQSALLADQQGIYLFTSRTAKRQSGGSSSAARKGPMPSSITDSQGGEQVIVQGMESVRPGAPGDRDALPSAAQSELIRALQHLRPPAAARDGHCHSHHDCGPCLAVW